VLVALAATGETSTAEAVAAAMAAHRGVAVATAGACALAFPSNLLRHQLTAQLLNSAMHMFTMLTRFAHHGSNLHTDIHNVMLSTHQAALECSQNHSLLDDAWY